MGYYTQHALKAFNSEFIENFEEELAQVLEDISGYDYEEIQGDEIKWYTQDENMLQLSKMYPDVIFELTGNGEEKEDIWRTYYKNGKKQEVNVQIVFESYDESKLK